MNILITGATGYVGQCLIKQLAQSKKHHIYAIVRNSSLVKKEQRLPHSIHIIDSKDISSIKNIDFDFVIHLAAFLTSKDDMESVRKILDSTIIFGIELLNALQDQHNLSFINIGTFAEYRTGTDKANPAYFYASAKHAFRSFLQYYATKGKWSYIHLIPYTIYGGENNQKKLIDYICESLDATEPVAMSPGKQVLDFIHINDVVDCICFMINNQKKWTNLHGKIFHLGTGYGTSIRDIASMFEQLSGKKCNIQWGGIPYREQDVMYAVAPIKDLINIGWSPNIKLQTGIQKILSDLINKKQIFNNDINQIGGG